MKKPRNSSKGEEFGRRCAWCDAYFTWVSPADGATPPIYCKPPHATRASRASKRLQTHFAEGECRSLGKVAYSSEGAALNALKAQPTKHGVRPYLCGCGKFHLGRVKRDVPTARRP